MPIARVQLPDGRIGRFNVPEGTTPEQVISFAQSQGLGNRQATVQEVRSLGVNPETGRPLEIDRAVNQPSISQRAIGGLEAGATLGSAALAEPVAGLIGAAIAPFGGADVASKAIGDIRSALTYSPVTQEGQRTLGAAAEVLKPVGKVVSGTEKFLGDEVFKATNSPTLAAAAATLPTALLETLGFKGGGKIGRATKTIEPSEKAIKTSLKQAAPSSEQLRNIAGGIYDELETSGVRLTDQSSAKLLNNIKKSAKRVSPRTSPLAAGLMEDLGDLLSTKPSLNDIRDIREVAKDIAASKVRREARVGTIAVRQIDDFLNNLGRNDLATGKIPPELIGKKLKAADGLWSRARKSELVAETIDKARNRASGFENGLRIEFDKIINNGKLSRYFDNSEISAMKGIVRGDLKQNIARLFGKFGTLGGRDQNALGALVAGGLGSATGGIPGFVTAVSFGSASRKVAQNLTKGKAEFLDTMIRAGNDGNAITKAYLRTVPKSKQSIADLGELLSDPNIDVSGLIKSSNKMIKEAAEIAAGRQAIGEAAGIAAAAAAQGQKEGGFQ